MISVIVTFQYENQFDPSVVTKVASGARTLFEGMPGLRYKFFTLDEQQRRATNFYVWETEDAARAFFTPELVTRVTGLYGVAPKIEYGEVVQAVENALV